MNLRKHLNTEPRGEPLRLAAALSCHPVMITQWANATKKVPPARCPAIELATAGRVTCEEMRPDITWARIKDAGWPNAAGRPLIDHAKAKA